MIIPVKTKLGDYDIVLETGALDKIGEYLPLERNVLVVTDSGVPPIYAEKVAKAAKCGNITVIPQGEHSKNFDSLKGILSDMLKYGFGRGDCVVAVGGGVVGDLSGFAASCYMRGIDFYNIPTTLLSQVDSSIGGKTAIDFEGVKNVVGAFYQPKRVVIDPAVLETLDVRQLRAGLVEAIKMAVTNDKELFELIENSEDLNADLEKIIYGALSIKKAVVEEDPTEKGIRKVLNFGHTIGHGIESFFDGKYLHGECVALGMIPMAAESVRERIIAVFEKYSIPTKAEYTADDVLPFILHDKKKTANGINAVFSDEIGSFRFDLATPDDIRSYMEEAL